MNLLSSRIAARTGVIQYIVVHYSNVMLYSNTVHYSNVQ